MCFGHTKTLDSISVPEGRREANAHVKPGTMVEKKNSKGGRPKLKEEDKRRHLVQLKVNDKELARLNEMSNKSRLSQADLMRAILFKSKITVYTHDSSLDKYAEKLAEGLTSMNKASENFNQAVKKLNSFQGMKEVANYLSELQSAIKEFNDQQKKMYDEKTHSCADRIASISQPHVRPIVRGKQGKAVEFGSKLGLSLNQIKAKLKNTSQTWIAALFSCLIYPGLLKT